RALVAAGAGLHPLAFAGYSVLIFLVLPAVVAVVVTAAAAGAQRAEPPAWVHALVAALALGGWTRVLTGDLGWALVYGVGAALAAGVAVLARGRGTRWGRIGVLALGVLAIGGAWAGLEGRGSRRRPAAPGRRRRLRLASHAPHLRALLVRCPAAGRRVLGSARPRRRERRGPAPRAGGGRGGPLDAARAGRGLARRPRDAARCAPAARSGGHQPRAGRAHVEHGDRRGGGGPRPRGRGPRRGGHRRPTHLAAVRGLARRRRRARRPAHPGLTPREHAARLAR